MKKFLLNRSRRKAVADLQKADTSFQVEFLTKALASGLLSHEALKLALESNAPSEMRKEIKKLAKQGKQPTVNLLLEEFDHDIAFQALAAEVGLDRAWFLQIAQKELNGCQAVE